MTAYFKQIRDDIDISEREGFGTIAISSFVILGLGLFFIMAMNVDPFVTGVIMIILAWFGRSIIRKLYGDFTKTNDIIGEVKFDIASITWLQNGTVQVLNSAEITSLNLKYNYIQGRQFVYKDIIHNGLHYYVFPTQ